VESLSAAQARRLAVAAQGLARPRPVGAERRLDRRHVRRLLTDTGLLQIDSVSAVARSHYLPGWSRLGGYAPGLLDRAAYVDRELFEYWGHEASLLPVGLHPLLRWRMARARSGAGTWGSVARVAVEEPELVRRVREQVADRGPLTAAELGEGEGRAGPWWGWGLTKRALEYLFWTGELTAAGRTSGFARRYDLVERVLPGTVLDAATPTEEDAHRALLLLAAARLGVATASDLGDYFRLSAADTAARVADLVAEGALLPVAVQGWRPAAYVLPGAVVPRRVTARTLVSPFDPLVWERPRVARLWAFDLRLEIYTPEPKRRWGYYVMPFLLGDALVARVDLRADRAARVLRVPGAYAEAGRQPGDVAGPLAAELGEFAAWLGLPRVEVGERGDLAAALAAAVAGTG
jgi:uncharacterized protein YcaQ